MAFDGVTVANLTRELSNQLTNGRITKIIQPEKDALILTIKNGGTYRLFLSAGAGLPLAYLTTANPNAPITAPAFCMLLRKHIGGGRIQSIRQYGMERVMELQIEHLDELGDPSCKYLIIELMGKHSNIIFTDKDHVILDSVKRISTMMSSVREVLPGRSYFIPNTMDKMDPLNIKQEQFCESILEKPLSVQKALYSSLTGFSPLLATELCIRASIDADDACASLTADAKIHLYRQWDILRETIQAGQFSPNIIYDENGTPIEFSAIHLQCYEDATSKPYETISNVLEDYYSFKEIHSRMHQKSVDLRKIIGNGIDRNRKKLQLQQKQFEDTKKRERYRVYGDLLTTYGYQGKKGDCTLTCTNFYDNEEITIPLDGEMTPIENAKRYYAKYNKLTRTYKALSIQISETKDELAHLESISSALDIATTEQDLAAIKEEMTDYGYLKKKTNNSKLNRGRKLEKSMPLHYRTPEGYDIYVGKNNYQNDELTFHFASDSDWWFHAKSMAGSHVILKNKGEAIPDSVFEQAARLAAFYSKGKGNDKVEIDYIEKKHVKKPNGSKPGFVVYYTNYSMVIDSHIGDWQEWRDE